jgi:DnaJ-class molecular chaperone
MAGASPGLEYKDYYAVLGVPRAASQADIKKAFRKLARQHHPDAKPGDTVAERRFKEINEANEVLGDPGKRKQYDELGANWEQISRARAAAGAAGGGPFAGFGGPGGNVRYEFGTSGDPGEFSDFFRVFFGEDAGAESIRTTQGPARGTRPTGGPGFEDILAGMGLGSYGAGQAGAGHGSAGAGRGRVRQGPPPGAEAHADISLLEAYQGSSRVVDVDGKRLEVKIPPGADTGTRIRLTGKAPGGGDLFVVVRQLPDARFTRRGADLERELALNLEQALLGAEVKVETLKGSVLLKIPAGTQNGRTFRLTGQGMPRFRANGHGDLYVKTKVILPTDLSEEATAAAGRFFDIANQSNAR